MKNFQRAGAVLLIIAAVFLVYSPAQRNGFVWDDTALVLRDPLIRSWRLIPESFRHFLFIDATPSNFYRPLQRLTFMADYAAWGFEPRGWHLTSVGVHAAAAVALYFLAKRLLASGIAALLVALVWAVHPLHTSAVTYVAGRADPLAALFGFTGLTLGLASLDGGHRAKLAMAGAAACFLAALLSKESGIAALIIWFMMLVWRRVPRRVFATWGALAAVILGAYAGLRFTAEKVEPPRRDPPPLAARPALAARALAEYARLLAAPVNLRMERDVSRGGVAQTAAGAALATGLIAWGAFAAWGGGKVAATSLSQSPQTATRMSQLLCLAAFGVAYLPISNLLPLNATVAEHWLYVPSAFLFAAVAAAGAHSPARLKVAATLIVSLWSVWLGVRTWDEQTDWKDQRTFFTRTIADGGDSARMQINLGNLEASEGNFERARQHLEEAVRREPDSPFALLGMAGLELRLKQPAAAAPYLDRVEKLGVFRAECLQMRATMEFQSTGRDTTGLLREAADLSPGNWPLRKRAINALDQAGRRDEALRELRTFLQRESFRGEPWRVLGELLASVQPQLALEAFTRASELDVRDAASRSRAGELRRVVGTPH